MYNLKLFNVITLYIEGVLSLLKDLCSKLSVPCYGIQMTELTPRTSIKEVARLVPIFLYISCISLDTNFLQINFFNSFQFLH